MARWIAAAILTFVSAMPAAAMTGEDLLESCTALLRAAGTRDDGKIVVVSEGQPCWYYMSAVVEMAVLADEDNDRLLGICAPLNGTLTQAIRVVVSHARKNPEQLHRNAALIAQEALEKAFPCP